MSSQTVWAMPAIVTGTYPLERNAVPTRRYFPNNLFTMLSANYRMTVFGRFQQLCPANRCAYDLEVHDSLTALVTDLSVVYAHVIAPDAVAARLPPILGDWRDFATVRRFRNEDGERRRNDRTSELDRFIETITPEREGQLYVSPHTHAAHALRIRTVQGTVTTLQIIKGTGRAESDCFSTATRGCPAFCSSVTCCRSGLRIGSSGSFWTASRRKASSTRRC